MSSTPTGSAKKTKIVDSVPTDFVSNPQKTNNIVVEEMSVQPESLDKNMPNRDGSFGAVCSRFIGRYPAIICVSMLMLFLGLSVPYRDAPAKMAGSSNNDWTVIMPPTDVNDMWNDARQRTSLADPSRKVKPRSQMDTGTGSVTFLYAWGTSVVDSTSKDIFTTKSIQEMCELERYFVDDDDYLSTFCPLSYSNNSDTSDGCAAQRLSAPRLFYAAMFLNHTVDCPLPSNYRTLMVSQKCMTHLSLTTTQVTAFSSIINVQAILQAIGKQMQGISLTSGETALVNGADGQSLLANNKAGVNFFTCVGANGASAGWINAADGSTVTSTTLPANPGYHTAACDNIEKTIRSKIEGSLYPIVATNPTDNQKYYVSSMPGTPSKLFNFTSFQRDENLKNGAYQLTGTEACPLLPQWHVDAVKEWLYTTVALDKISLGNANMTGEQLLGFFMDKDTLKNSKTSRTRSMIYMGSPLLGYKDSNDRGKEQRDLYKDYMLKFEPKLFKQFNMKETMDLSLVEQTLAKSPYRTNPKTEGDLAVDWYSGAMNQQEFDRMLGGDFAMVGFSVIFVWIWIQVHTWSTLIGGLGMLEILLSIPVTYTIYTIFVPYYSQMHILAVFLVLGVGADDVFVMTDGWKQSVRDVVPVPGESKKDRLVRRMTYAYGRTASAVFNTSFTTAMAFVSTAISPIMTISAFGTYAAIAILVNYIMVITWFPAVILTAELYIFPKFGIKWGPQDEDVWTDELAQLGPGEELEAKSVSKIDSCFENVYAKWMMWSVKVIQCRGNKDDKLSGKCCDRCHIRPCATIWLILTATWAAVMIWQTSKLEPPTKAEAFFPDDHMSTGIIDIMSEEYLGAGAASYQTGALIFGLKSLDRSKFDRYNPDFDRGIVSFDDDFDIYSKKNQLYLLNVCQTLEEQVCRVLDKSDGNYLEACTGKEHKLVRSGTLNCWIREFHAWHKDKYSTEAFDNDVITKKEFTARLLKFRKEEKPANEDAGNSFKNSIGVIETGVEKLEETSVSYVSFEFTSSMVTRKPVGVKQPLYDMMEEVVKKISSDAPTGLKYVSQDFGFRGWVWMETEKALVNGLFNGLLICFPIAFCVLAFATLNLPLALIATLAIGCIVASVLGFVKAFNGWDLGIAETIAGIIVIGFSVDYVVHMGHMYIEAAEKSGAMTREKRFFYAASKMGSTVMAGAITTAGSGAFMFMCQMRFFYKMAVLITLTIGFSFLFSFGFFMAYMILIGPEFDSGNLNFICGGSLVKHAEHSVQNRKDALQHWKAMRLKNTNNDDKKIIELPIVKDSTSDTTTDKKELSDAEILNWGN